MPKYTKMTSKININGLEISFDNGKLTIDGLDKEKGAFGQRNKEVEITKSGNIDGDITGNIKITGDNVSLLINGDVTGNIEGNCEIEVKGDIVGNIVGGKIKGINK